MKPVRSLHHGFSLIDMIIGLAVGLMVALAITSTLATLNIRRNHTLAGNDARDSAQAAVAILEGAAKVAGVGLFYNKQPLCQSLTSGTGTNATTALLWPLKITDGATGSDSITVAWGEAKGGNSVSSIVGVPPDAAADYVVANPGALVANDMAIAASIGSPTTPCTLFQVSSIGSQLVDTGSGGAPCYGLSITCVPLAHANPNYTGAPLYGSSAATGPSVVARLGDFKNFTYAVLCNSLVVAPAGATPGCTAATSTTGVTFANGTTPLAADVVMLKAQYGLSASSNSTVVTSWVSASQAPWGSLTTPPTAADIALIKAIRIVVVSRAKEPSGTLISPACMNSAGTGPCSFSDSAAPVIDLSGTAPVIDPSSNPPSRADWRKYRYQVYSTVVPLRSVIWN